MNINVIGEQPQTLDKVYDGCTTRATFGAEISANSVKHSHS